MTDILNFVESNQFDFFSTIFRQPIYMRRNKIQLQEHECFGYDYITDPDTHYSTYTKCNKKIKDAYVCSDHESYEIKITNDKEINTITSIDQLDEHSVVMFNYDHYYYPDNKLSNSVYNRKTKKGNCVSSNFKQYVKCSYVFYFNKNYFTIHFYDESYNLILKAAKYFDIYPNIEFIFNIFDLFHDKNVVIKLKQLSELVHITFQNIVYYKLSNCKLNINVANIIHEKFFRDSTIGMLKNYMDNFAEFKPENLYKQFKMLLHLMFNYYTLHKKYLKESKKFAIAVKKRIVEIQLDMKERKIQITDEDKIKCDMIENGLSKFLDKI